MPYTTDQPIPHKDTQVLLDTDLQYLTSHSWIPQIQPQLSSLEAKKYRDSTKVVCGFVLLLQRKLHKDRTAACQKHRSLGLSKIELLSPSSSHIKLRLDHNSQPTQLTHTVNAGRQPTQSTHSRSVQERVTA